MLTRPDITRPRPRPRPNLRGRGQRVRGRKVYRYGRVNDSCNYVTYFGYVIKKCQQNKATYKTVVTTTVIVEVPCSSSPRPNIMQVVNESVQLKNVFQAVGPRPWPRSTRGRGQASRPHIPVLSDTLSYDHSSLDGVFSRRRLCNDCQCRPRRSVVTVDSDSADLSVLMPCSFKVASSYRFFYRNPERIGKSYDSHKIKSK